MRRAGVEEGWNRIALSKSSDALLSALRVGSEPAAKPEPAPVVEPVASKPPPCPIKARMDRRVALARKWLARGASLSKAANAAHLSASDLDLALWRDLGRSA